MVYVSLDRRLGYARARYEVAARAYDAAAQYAQSFGNLGKLRESFEADIAFAEVVLERAQHNYETTLREYTRLQTESELNDVQARIAIIRERNEDGIVRPTDERDLRELQITLDDLLGESTVAA